MKPIAKAFAPGNISCIFKIYENENPAKMGSFGMGFTINKGVTVEASLDALSFLRRRRFEEASALGVQESSHIDSRFRGNDKEECRIYFNKKKMNFPTVKSVVKKLAPSLNKNIRINISSDLPLGSGFGLSGASALATAYALNSLLNLKYTNLELAKIAHIAEVENRTGLGDVVNQYFGGFLLKLKPSSEFVIQKIPIEDISIYCKYFSKLSTKAVISDPKRKESINRAATNTLKKAYKLIKEDITKSGTKFSDLISVSKEFAQKSGLLTNKKVINTIKKIEAEGGHASMIMLGNSVFSDIPFTGSLKLKISNTPAHLLCPSAFKI